MASRSRIVSPLTAPRTAAPPRRRSFAEQGPTQDAETTRVPLGTICGARSGNKGGNADVGVWARSDVGYAQFEKFLAVERFKSLIGEAHLLEVRRFAFPNTRSLNSIIVGLLGEGVSSNSRTDPQAKSLGEYLRAKVVELPAVLLADAP